MHKRAAATADTAQASKITNINSYPLREANNAL